MTAVMGQPHIGLVVEGAGDQGGVPVLLRNYLHSQGIYADVLGKPVPTHGRDKATMQGGIEGYCAIAAARPGCEGVLVILDGEGDCVADLGAALINRARPHAKVPVKVALAEATFEDWLYASIETLGISDQPFVAGRSGLGQIVSSLRPKKYVKPTWQPRLAAHVDLALAASRSPSLRRALERFDELCRGFV